MAIEPPLSVAQHRDEIVALATQYDAMPIGSGGVAGGFLLFTVEPGPEFTAAYNSSLTRALSELLDEPVVIIEESVLSGKCLSRLREAIHTL